MSLTPSMSTSSTSSSNTNHRMQSNEQDDLDPSNRLYNDHQNYQIIFSNDSRFFDTSLHLYKSYRKLGYIQVNSRNKNNASRINFDSTLQKSTNNISNSKSSRVIHHRRNDNDDNNNTTNTLKPQTRISTDQRSDSSFSNVRSTKVTSNVSLANDRPWPSRNSNENDNNNGDDDDDDDEADIIITKL